MSGPQRRPSIVDHPDLADVWFTCHDCGAKDCWCGWSW